SSPPALPVCDDRDALSVVGHFAITDSATTAIYTLSLHDALPIFDQAGAVLLGLAQGLDQALQALFGLVDGGDGTVAQLAAGHLRSEEHTSELQSRENLVCRLLLEKQKRNDRKSRPSPPLGGRAAS